MLTAELLAYVVIPNAFFFFSEIAKSNTDEKILYSLSKTFFINHFYCLICLRTKVKPSTMDSSSHFHTHSQDCGQCRVNR